MNNTPTEGPGILGILLIIFIVLKLLGVITWSWWLVLIPLWIPLGILLIVSIIAIIGYWIINK